MPVKIFIGNLSSDTTDHDLRPLFEKYGEVTECDVLRNFGFVHMLDDGEAERAINELAGTLVRGQRINVEKSTGSTKGGSGGGGRGGGGRGDGGGKMMGRGGRGAGRGGRGGPGRGRGGSSYGRDYDPYPPPRGHPYDRDPYDYYDRYERPPPRIPPPYPEDRRPYSREERLPPPRDPYDRYPPPPRYPPPERYPYERLPPRSADPYDRPPPDYYRAYDGYDDPVGRLPPHEEPVGPPGVGRARDAANGFDDRRPEVRPGGGDSYSSSYSSYYDRFYSKVPANGDRQQAIPPPAARPGMPPGPGGNRMLQQGRPNPAMQGGQSANDQQSKLQTGPIYF